MDRSACLVVVCLLALVMLLAPPSMGQVTREVTYQGRLHSGGAPYFGTADFIVTLRDAAAGGSQVGLSCAHNAVTVSDGYIKLTCDFGADAFATSENRWMQIEVQAPAGVGGFTALTPRQKVTATPFALQSKSLEFPYDAQHSLSNDSLIDMSNTGTWGIASAFIGSTKSPDGIGIIGQAVSATGRTEGVRGRAASDEGVGVYGYADNVIGSTVGVRGVAESESGVGVLGEALSITGNAVGGLFYSDSAVGTALWGDATSTFGYNVGIRGYTRSERGLGIYGRAFHTNGLDTAAGRFDNNTRNSGYGVWGETTYNGDVPTTGVAGRTRSRSLSAAGVSGIADSNLGGPTGVYGESRGGIGVWGRHSGAGGVDDRLIGVLGESESGNGTGVKGIGATAVEGVTFTGEGVLGLATATNNAPTSRGGYFENWGTADQTAALEAYAASEIGLVHGFMSSLSFLNTDQGSTAGLFNGPVRVADDVDGRRALQVLGRTSLLGDVIVGGSGSGVIADLDVSGNLTKGGGTFRIDHPLDPENMYLQHSFVESPDMMNIYNGNVTTDEEGYAHVALPDWFEALNRDFRYQLTVIDTTDGADFVLAKVVQEIEDKTFVIRTSAARTRVSWQVTGVRHDPYAELNRIQVEVEKPEAERGGYLHTDAYAASR